MKIISFLNGKGGVGKTTLSILVATCLARMGFKVCVVDTDPQGSVTSWNENSNALFDVVIATNDREIYSLPRTLKYYNYVIIDGAAAISSITNAAAMISDVVIIPLSASPLDFAACSGVLAVLDARQALKPIEARFLISKAVNNAKMTTILKESIKETGFETLRTSTSHRQSYVRSLLEGGTIYDSDDGKAKGEIDLITREILELAA